jgi:predicted AAA+ superfamily ATPase
MAMSLNGLIEAHRRERDAALKKPAISRTVSVHLAQALSSGLIKVITGPRRAGKSTLAFQALANRSFAYLNFEDDALSADMSGDDIVHALDAVYGKTDFIFFDEIQNYPRWESFVNKLHRRGKNLLLTGSNSHLLSRELGSALTGRHLAFELLPFSFLEYQTAKPELPVMEAFSQYSLWGGFPEIVVSHEDPANYLRHLFDSIVLHDIVTRHRIRASTGIHDLLQLLMTSIASRFSARSLERALGALSIATIQKFIGYAREAYLVQDLQPFFFKARLRLKADRKIYAYDNGFISAKTQPAISNESQRLENLVFVELLRRGFQPNSELFYYQTRSGYEVDFLIRRGSVTRELIQVTKTMTSLKTREREIRALIQAAEEVGHCLLTIITEDTTDHILEGNRDIRVIPAWQWFRESFTKKNN